MAIIGIIDKNSFLGKIYQVKKVKGNTFYKEAHFLSIDEVISFLKEKDFKRFCFYQTLFHPLEKIKDVEPIKKGYGKGGFVVISAEKS